MAALSSGARRRVADRAPLHALAARRAAGRPAATSRAKPRQAAALIARRRRFLIPHVTQVAGQRAWDRCACQAWAVLVGLLAFI